MSLQFEQIEDAVLLTQQQFIKRGTFLNMQTDLTDHVAVRELWKGQAHPFSGGEDWQFDVQMDHNHSARTVGLYETDGSALTDTMKKGKVKVRHVNAHYVYDLREPAFQRGGTGIVDIIKTRYTGMMISLYELLEEILWSKPADSSDLKTPYGIAYWITRSNTEGFNGGNPAGFADGRADIDTGDYPRWANWTAQYAAITKEDLLRKMRTGHRRSRFRSPVSHGEPSIGPMHNGIYVNGTTLGLLEELLEDRNMNLGTDLAKYDGRTTFKSTPMTYAPKLDDDALNPLYMIDWKWFQCGTLEGWQNNMTKPYMVPGMHNVRRVDLDASLNTICTDLRRQAVFTL